MEAVSIYGVPIVVDDGANDVKAGLANQAGGVVISHQGNRGYDEALSSGFKKALEIGYEIIITVDGDGQHAPVPLQVFIDQIDAGADIDVGVRSKRQRLADDLFAVYTMLRFGIKDPLCGMKACRTTVYAVLGLFDWYMSIGTELMLFASLIGYRFSQVRFDVRERRDESIFGRVLDVNYKICRAMLLSLWRFDAHL